MAELKCEKCGHEFKGDEKEHKAFVLDGRTMCDECLFRMGVDPAGVETWMMVQHRQEQERPPRY